MTTAITAITTTALAASAIIVWAGLRLGRKDFHAQETIYHNAPVYTGRQI